MTLREAFAEYLRDQAGWRRLKAEEYPDDFRNLQSAAGLEELAEYVTELPPSDERLLQLDALTKFTEAELDVFSAFVGDENVTDLGQEISRFRFNGHAGDGLWSPDAFLSFLVRRAIDEATRAVR